MEKTRNSRKTACRYAFSDITGKRFIKLTALYPTEKRTTKGSVIWHCRCDCGNESDISYNKLMYCSVGSCGCMKKEHNKKLSSFLNHVEGTSIEAIKSKKVPSDNTTGCRGVYRVGGKYLSKIVFQKKQYYLGKYDNYDDAVEARKEAEKALFDSFAVYYERWKSYADVNPKWAKENPVRLYVSKENERLSVIITPEIPQKEDEKAFEPVPMRNMRKDKHRKSSVKKSIETAV